MCAKSRKPAFRKVTTDRFAERISSLKGRGLEVSWTVEEPVNSCEDLDPLERWMRRAVFLGDVGGFFR
jgi:hypothetical protein